MIDLPRPSAAPCGTCPYRQDVPSGIWHASEYAKLPGYDGDVIDQLQADATRLFFCHQKDGSLCAGWVGCHDTGNLLALRLHPVHPDTFEYQSPVELFESGEAAAAHGMAAINNPDNRARFAIDKLRRRRGR